MGWRLTLEAQKLLGLSSSTPLRVNMLMDPPPAHREPGRYVGNGLATSVPGCEDCQVWDKYPKTAEPKTHRQTVFFPILHPSRASGSRVNEYLDKLSRVLKETFRKQVLDD